MSKFKIIALLLMFSFISSFNVFAQTDNKISDKEIASFAGIVQQIQMINQKAQQEMIGVIQAEGMDVQRFNEIFQAKQNPNAEVKATDEEMASYNDIAAKFQTIQMKTKTTMEDAIKDGGMTLERYQEIGTQVQSDPALQQKIQAHFQQN